MEQSGDGFDRSRVKGSNLRQFRGSSYRLERKGAARIRPGKRRTRRNEQNEKDERASRYWERGNEAFFPSKPLEESLSSLARVDAIAQRGMLFVVSDEDIRRPGFVLLDVNVAARSWEKVRGIVITRRSSVNSGENPKTSSFLEVKLRAAES